MVQVPTAIPVMVLPLIPELVHMLGVVETKVTVKPEVAVALAAVVALIVNAAGKKVIVPMV